MKSILSIYKVKQFVLWVCIPIGLFIVLQKTYVSIDLTADKRYSLSEGSKQVLQQIEQPIHIEIFLAGKLPGAFQQLQQATLQTVQTFQQHSSQPISYSLVDLDELSNEKQKELLDFFAHIGVELTNLNVKTTSGYEQRLIIPWAIVQYGNKSGIVPLLMNQQQLSGQEALSRSVTQLEYHFMHSIQKLSTTKQIQVGIVQNHSVPQPFTASLQQLIEENQYACQRIDLDSTSLDSLDLVLVVGPQQAFTTQQKFELDQYIMKGGKTMWFVSGTQTNFQFLSKKQEHLVIANQHGLDDLLFTYGARINHDVLVDPNFCDQIPLVVGNIGNKSQTDLMPWPYAPLALGNPTHAISRHIEPIVAPFVSSIDVIDKESIVATPLLAMSPTAISNSTPAKVDFTQASQAPKKEGNNQAVSPKIAGLLLEGQFPSFFKNRVFGKEVDQVPITLSLPTQLIVLASAEIAMNEINQAQRPFPIGINRFTKQQYGNHALIANMIDYLLDEQSLLAARQKEIGWRQLNQQTAATYEQQIQILNIGLPVGLLLIIGFVVGWYRKRLFAK